MYRYKTGEFRKGETDIVTLPDNTFFYVLNENGWQGWMGYVTTENGQKVMYTDVSLNFPTEDYADRIVLNGEYILDIDGIETGREHHLGEKSIQVIERCFRELMKILAKNTQSQSDEFAQGMKILDAMREECDLPESVYEERIEEPKSDVVAEQEER